MIWGRQSQFQSVFHGGTGICLYLVLSEGQENSKLWFNLATLQLDLSTRWTNEQHSSYLNYLEASFVNELQCSMRLRGWSSQYDSKEAVKFGSRLRLAPAERACAKRESDVYGSGMLCDRGIPVRGISTSPRSVENHCGYHSCHLESVSCTAGNSKLYSHHACWLF